MTTATAPQSVPPQARQAVATMYTGMALTAITTILVPVFIALATDDYTDYISVAYPKLGAEKVSNYQQTMVIYLVVNGAVGILAWLWTLRSAKKGKRSVPVVASVVFALGLVLALFNLLIKDSTGYAALSPLLGIAGLLPCAAGLAAVVMLWRARPSGQV
ncbi:MULTISPECIES: hypothetical protein [Streptomyces]|uniref:Uncharacterized protein n=1 Tax=Streptomyces yunnanensis TaxID=156453 RepID=A0ABY8AKD0_9ACTN|nr:MULTISPECIES: hypothetical protein [Streptomyces]WEB45490.1 hypothetical protein MOV08_43565 [Streptomyces yunnanensis]